MPAHLSQQWSEARVEQLKELWQAGLSCSKIALAIGGGISRCAVIGKAARLDLAMRKPGSKGSAKPKPFRLNVGQPKPPYIPPPPPEAPPSLKLDMEHLTRSTCRWPEGDTAPFLFCGHPVRPDSPWCPFHTKIAWAGKSPHRAAAAE